MYSWASKIPAKVLGLPAMAVALLCFSPPSMADRFDETRLAISRDIRERNVPGVAVAVWRDGKILWEEGFGWADMEGRVPVDAHTTFALASLSKTLTAAGVMTLVQAGKVDLDGPINHYLKEDTLTVRIGDPREVTVRRVANHSAGIVGSSQFFYGDEARYTPSMSETIRRYGLVVYPPGERYLYSNIGYGVLGHLIEQVSGQRYADYMRNQVFLPLGMTRSSVYLLPGHEPYQAIRYDFDRKPIPAYTSAEPASAMIYSSAHDLARFGMFMLKNHRRDQRAILSDASIDEMARDPISTESRPVRVAKGEEDGYAVGLGVSYQGGYRTIGHDGSMSGVATVFALVPEENLGVVVLANADGGTGRIPELLLKSVLKWSEPSPTPESKPAVAGPPPAPQPPAALQGRWEGEVHTYEGKLPITLQVQAGGEVHVQIGGAPKYPNRSTIRQPALVNGVTFKDGELSGHSLAQLETSDGNRHPHVVDLRLRLRDGQLKGTVMKDSVYDGFWRQGLPYWTMLERKD